MDFLWFWVSVGLAVEVVRQSYQHCTPKKPKANDNNLTEPLLQQDGSCHYACCAKDVSGEFEIDDGLYEASTSDDGEADEVVSSDEIEEFEESLIDNRKGKRLADEYQGNGDIVGTVYSRSGGGPKLVHFTWADNYFEVFDNAGARGLKRESSAKVHPEALNGTAEEEVHDASKDISSPHLAKDIKHCVATPALSDEYTLLPPIQEVMHHGHILSGEESQPADGTVATPK